MNVYWVSTSTPSGPLTPELDKALSEPTVVFVCVVISVLGGRLVGAYLHTRNVKELWDAHESKFGTIDVGGELHAIEQFNDYIMVENCSVVKQAH